MLCPRVYRHHFGICSSRLSEWLSRRLLLKLVTSLGFNVRFFVDSMRFVQVIHVQLRCADDFAAIRIWGLHIVMSTSLCLLRQLLKLKLRGKVLFSSTTIGCSNGSSISGGYVKEEQQWCFAYHHGLVNSLELIQDVATSFETTSAHHTASNQFLQGFFASLLAHWRT